MRWFERMRLRAQELWHSGQPVVLLGDWNVVPTDRDIYKPDTWRDDALLQPEPRQAFAALLSQGWTDALESVHPGGKQFNGLRISDDNWRSRVRATTDDSG